MEYAFLKSGAKVIVHEKTEKGFIVEPVYSYDSYCENEEHEEPEEAGTGTMQIVDVIYKTEPVELFSPRVLELEKTRETLTKEVQGLNLEKRTITNELETIKKTLISKTKFIIDKSDLINAQQIVLFPKDSIAPLIQDRGQYGFRGLKINLEVSIYENEERAWGYKLIKDDRDWGNFLDPEFGYLINPTEEEILAVVHKRCAVKSWDKVSIRRTADKWLTPELLEKKQQIIEQEAKDKEIRLEHEIEAKKKELKTLKEKNNESTTRIQD